MTKTALATALLLSLSACEGGGGGDTVELGGANASGDATATALERLALNEADPRFVAFLYRSEIDWSGYGLSFPGGGYRTSLPSTHVDADFWSVGEGRGAQLVELLRRWERSQTDGCAIHGAYDGVEYDDSGVAATEIFGDDVAFLSDVLRSARVGNRLPITDESGPWAALVLDEGELALTGDDEEIDFLYDLERDPALDRDAIGALTIDVSGSNTFPDVGQVVLPAVEALKAEPVETDARRKASPDAVLRWTAGTSGDGRMFVEYGVYDDLGELDIECRTEDDGEFVLPDAVLSRLPETLSGVDGLYLSREVRDTRLVGDVLVSTTSDHWIDLLDPASP